jgi:RNA polymerase subunit RPABC4/transcription elongation factor Spt4
MKTPEQFLIDACKEMGFTEDYSKMIFKINPDSSNAYIFAMHDYATQYALKVLKIVSELKNDPSINNINLPDHEPEN